MMGKKQTTALAILAFALLSSCQEQGDDDATDTAPSETKGAIEIEGTWKGDPPAQAIPKAALFNCPFKMPPAGTAAGTISGDRVQIAFEDLEPGTWCVLAFLDVDENDGVKWIDGVDWVAYPAQGKQSFELKVEAGKTAQVEVVFERREAADTDTDTDTE